MKQLELFENPIDHKTEYEKMKKEFDKTRKALFQEISICKSNTKNWRTNI